MKLRQISREVAVIPADGALIYMENGWELTSELTSKWITFKNIQSNFTLISLITFEVLNQTAPVTAVIPADDACKMTWKTVVNWRLNSRRNE